MSLVLSKAIRLVDLVAAGANTLNALAAASEMSRSTTHRLLATLVEHGYLAIEDKKYVLGFRLLELGEQKRRSLSFLEVLRPILVRYAAETCDTIHLAVLDGTDIVLLDRVFGDRQLRINSYPGLRNTAFMTAVGKVLIGNLPPKRWPSFVAGVPPAYPRSVEAILADFERARQSNIAMDMDECNVGTCGVASSFRVNDRLRVACSINGATVYFGDNRLAQLGAVAKAMAEELKRTLDSQMPNLELDSRNLASLR